MSFGGGIHNLGARRPRSHGGGQGFDPHKTLSFTATGQLAVAGDTIPPITGTTPNWRGDWLTGLGGDPAPLDGGHYDNYQCVTTTLLSVVGSGITSANFPSRSLQVSFDGSGGGGGGTCQTARVVNQWAAPVTGAAQYMFIRYYWYCTLPDTVTLGDAGSLGACHPFQEGDNGRWYNNFGDVNSGHQLVQFQFPSQSFPQNRYGVNLQTSKLWMISFRLNLYTATACQVSGRIHDVLAGTLFADNDTFLDNNWGGSQSTLAVDNPDLVVSSGSQLRDIWVGNNGIGTNDQFAGKVIFFFAPAVRISSDANDWIGSWTSANG